MLFFYISLLLHWTQSEATYEFQFYQYSISQDFHQASKACAELGNNWYLPNGNTYSDELALYMKERELEYAWLSLTKETFKMWKWVNGTIYYGELSQTPGAGCAGVAIQGRRLRSMNCGEKGNGFICEMPETVPCPLRQHRQNCLIIGETIFHLGCFTESWYHARSYCVENGGDLAILDTTEKQQAVLNYIIEKKYVGKCSWIFVGLRLEDWYAYPKRSVPHNLHWGLDQPRAEHSCSRTDNNGIWWSYPCDQPSTVICQNYHNATSVKEMVSSWKSKADFRASHGHWMVSCLVFLGLFIGMICVVFYIQRGRWSCLCMKKSLPQFPFSNKKANVVIFSTKELAMAEEAQSLSNVISNIDWNSKHLDAVKISSTDMQFDLGTVIVKGYQLLEEETLLHILNIYSKNFETKEDKLYLPKNDVKRVLEYLLRESDSCNVSVVLLPQFDKDLVCTEEMLHLLWQLRKKVILVTTATPVPSLPADEVIAVCEHTDCHFFPSGNVDFSVSADDPAVNKMGHAFVAGLAAALLQSFPSDIRGTGNRTKIMRRVLLSLIQRNKNAFQGFGSFVVKDFAPSQIDMKQLIQRVYREYITEKFPCAPGDAIKAAKEEQPGHNHKIKIGLIRPCKQPGNRTFFSRDILVKGKESEELFRNEEELSTLEATFSHLANECGEQEFDGPHIHDHVELVWFGLLDKGWNLDETLFLNHINDFNSFDVIYFAYLAEAPKQNAIQEAILHLSRKCIVVTKAINEKYRLAPCEIPADRAISIGRTKSDARKYEEQRKKEKAKHVTELEVKYGNEPYGPDIRCKGSRKDRHNKKKTEENSLLDLECWGNQSYGSTLDFVCGFDLPGEEQVKPATCQALAVIACVLVKARISKQKLGLTDEGLKHISTTPVMHTILRQMSSHLGDHTIDEGWGELQPQKLLNNDDCFKGLIDYCLKPNNANKNWAGKNV